MYLLQEETLKRGIACMTTLAVLGELNEALAHFHGSEGERASASAAGEATSRGICFF